MREDKRSCYFSKIFLVSLTLVLSAVTSFAAAKTVAAQKVPIYKHSGKLGPKYNLKEELNLRIKGLIDGNQYVVRNEKGKLVERLLDIQLNEKSKGHSFSISSFDSVLHLAVDVQMIEGQVVMFFGETPKAKPTKEAEKSPQKPGEMVMMKVPWRTPSVTGVQALLLEIGSFGQQAARRIASKVADSNGGIPPNHEEMARLALLVAVQLYEPKSSDQAVGAYYNLLNYLFTEFDTVRRN